MTFDYTDIVNTLDSVFTLTKEEKETLLTSPAPKLIAMIPYACSFEDPDRFAIINMSSYMLAKRKVKALLSRPSDKDHIGRRLKGHSKPDHNFDVHAYNYGMALLELMNLIDQHTDLDLDKKNNKFNLIADGGWDFQAMKKDLVAQASYLSKNVKPETLSQFNSVTTVSTLQTARSGNW